MIFILGSPRTGSTLVYQILINTYNLCYFNNLTNNYFYKYPFISTFLSQLIPFKVDFKSDHGKTNGLLAPSEGSNIFKNWFGDTNKILPNKRNSILKTFKHISKPIVIKNAWNCFRIKTLIELFPECVFIWIRRDIIQSAISDLKSRYIRGGPYVWNSAPTSDYEDIIKLPYWEQVVEQQYSYNKTIETNLKTYCPNNYMEIWYEDVCNDSNKQLTKLSAFLNIDKKNNIPLQFEIKRHSINNDFVRISGYVKNNLSKFERYLRNAY